MTDQDNLQFTPSVKRFLQGSSLLVILVGSLVFLGWIIDIPILKSAIIGMAPMKANTSICFILLGMSLWLLQKEDRSQQTIYTTRLLLSMIMIISLLTLSEYLFKWDLGIDQLIIQESDSPFSIQFPGRMTLITACNFVLISFALLLLDIKIDWKDGIIQAVALITALDSFLILCGYIFGVKALYSSYAQVAIHSVALIFISSFNILFIRTNHSIAAFFLSDSAGGFMLRKLLPVTICFPVLLGWLRLTGQKAGWYSTEFGVSIVVVTNVLFFAIVMFRSAKSLNQMDSRRQNIEDTLRERDIRLRRLVESNLMGVVTTDLNGYIIEANDAFLHMLGYSHIDLPTHRSTRENLPFLQYPIFDEEIIDQLKRSGSCTPVERELICKDGSRVNVLLGVTSEESTNHCICFTLDLSEQKEAQEKMREQAMLLDVTLDAIMVRDIAGKILFWNKGAEVTYGWSAEEAIGQSAKGLLYKANSARVNEVYTSVIEKGQWIGELDQITKTGKEITIHGRWTLMYDNDGQPKAILIVNTDITEKKQLEAQFLRAQRLESIGTLAGGIAHDLNNVLSPILMSIQMLKKKINDERSQLIINMMETNVRRGADLIKQVLSFSRGIEGERIPINLKSLVLELEKVARQTFPKSIEINTNIQQELWSILGDMTQLHQVLMNLLVNARDAMPKGGRLSINVENLLIDETYARMNIDATVGPYLVISITDNGSGIPEEVLDKIFEPFFTTKEIGKGTGLGLSTVIGIVKNHNGFVQVYSEEGKGTQFKIYLPALESPEVQQAQKALSELPMGQGETILVIDDELAIREITKSSLEAFNYKVIVARDGAEALSMYINNKHQVSIVLTDMMMPIMDGSAIIRTLKQIDPKLHIIAASGLSSKEKIDEINDLGVDTFLPKPFTAETLLNTLNSICTKN